MESRKRQKKAKVSPDDGEKLVGSDNISFQMDDIGDSSNNNKNSSQKYNGGAKKMFGPTNALAFLSNVRAGVSKWKSYASNRRVRKRAMESAKHEEHLERVAAASEDSEENRQLTAGLGLDDIHDDFTNYKLHQQKVTKSVKKDFEMSVASNQALIQYFAKLGQSNKDDETINLDFVHTLVTSGADINCTDKYGQTVLHEVARAWHTDVAKFLIEHGADINKGDRYGRTPLHVASAVDYPDMVNLLIDNGADKEAKTKGEDQTPVFYAAKTDAVQSLKALIKRGCLFKKERDFKGRTPIHVAAELDRSETARLLLELQAPVYLSDNEGSRAITWMINKMAPVANEALNQFHLTDRPNRKQYFYLNFLVRDKDKDPQGKAQTPLQIAVGVRQYDLIMHAVFIRLLEVMWNKFGRFWALYQLGINFVYILLWTIIGIAVEYDKRHIYKMPDDTWRIFLVIFAAVFTLYQIYEEVMEYRRSQRVHSEWEKKRIADIERDLEYCHPRWPEEEKYLRNEIGEMEKLKPKYFSDMWNIFDWICYVMLLACITTHVADVLSHTEILARAHIRLMSVTIILLWLRLMKNARAFALLGPFIVMLGHMLKDCVRFLFLYMEFYIPYLAAFWMIFGGTKKASDDSSEEVTVSGYTYPAQLIFSMFRLTLVDEYDYDNMQKIDAVMADILLGTWFLLSAVLCLNLFIALLSDTFQRVYDNAQANAVMQKAITILNIWEGISSARKERFLNYIGEYCSPLKDDYDDDLTGFGDDDVKKVTIQIKEDLDNFQEMFRLRFGDPRSNLLSTGDGMKRGLNGPDGGVSSDTFESEVGTLKESLNAVKVQQDVMATQLSQDMKSVKIMLKQLLGKDPGIDEGSEAPPSIDTASEYTPVSKLKKKKRKPRPMSAGLEIDSEDQGSVQSSKGFLEPDVPEFSPGYFPHVTRSVDPQAFDVTMSPTSMSQRLQPPAATDEGDSTNC